jgi:protein-disulfide isomerase
VIEDDATPPAATARADPPPGGRLRAALLPPTAVHWGWWAAGLGMGTLLATVALTVVRPAEAAPPRADKATAAMVREAILADPQVIPDAINRLQQMEVEKLLASNREAIETPFAGAWAGAEQGDVVLVEFFDYNCPYCRQSTADVDRLLKEDPGLKVVFRDLPVLGPDSERFARASLSAAEQGRYRRFYTDVFRGQGSLTQERLIRHVRAAGLNEARVAQDLNSKAITEAVTQNLELGRALGLTGTPSYVVGNRILSGAVGYDELKQAIAEARKTTA